MMRIVVDTNVIVSALVFGGVPRTGIYWHNGGTGGYTSDAAFSPKDDRAVVVLYNREDLGSAPIMFVERVAANVGELISGKPALPLE